MEDGEEGIMIKFTLEKKDGNVSLKEHKIIPTWVYKEAIVKDQKFSMREYDYKGDLDEFAGDNGYSDENAFVEKFGKDSVVKAMLVQKAQDYVIEHANIAYK